MPMHVWMCEHVRNKCRSEYICGGWVIYANIFMDRSNSQKKFLLCGLLTWVFGQVFYHAYVDLCVWHECLNKKAFLGVVWISESAVYAPVCACSVLLSTSPSSFCCVFLLARDKFQMKAQIQYFLLCSYWLRKFTWWQQVWFYVSIF